MFKSKVINLYNSFSVSEKKALYKFIHSPIHNQHTDVIALIKYLGQLKKLTPQNVDRKLIHKNIFKDKAFSESNIRHISSYLYKVIEDFIVFQDASNSNDLKYKALIKFFRKKGHHNLVKSTIKKYDKIESESKIDSNYFHEKYLVLNEIALVQEHEQTNRTKGQTNDHIDYLDKYYIAEKLKQSSTSLSHQTIFGNGDELSLIDSIISYVQEKDLLKIPAIAIHYYNYFMVKESDNELHFKNFMSILLENSNSFEAEELKDLYVLGINYNLRKANKGSKEYPQKVFDLYKLGLENRALLPLDILSHVTYRNIMNTALYLKKHKWALNFITKYKDFLEDDVREDTYNFNLAHYYCKIDDFENSLRILATIDLKDENYISRAKVLQLKMYYESEEYDVLESLLDSFWIYLKRKKHLGYHRDLWFKLIRYVKSILHTKAGDHKRLQKILGQINAEKDMMEKKWLTDQVEVLLKRR